MSKEPTKKNKGGKPKFSGNGKRITWFKTVDWNAWKNEFFTTVNEDGTYFYPTTYHFARAKVKEYLPPQFKQVELCQLIRDAIGPKSDLRVPHLGDWYMEREEGRVLQRKEARMISDVVQKELDAGFTGRAVAATYVRYDAVVDQILEELMQQQGGRIFRLKPDEVADEKKWRDEEKERYSFFMHCLNELLSLKIKVDTQILKASGFEQPSFVANFIKQQAMIADTTPATQSGDRVMMDTQQVKGKILATAMTAFMEKAAKYNLPLPEDLQNVKEQYDDIEKKAEAARKINP